MKKLTAILIFLALLLSSCEKLKDGAFVESKCGMVLTKHIDTVDLKPQYYMWVNYKDYVTQNDLHKIYVDSTTYTVYKGGDMYCHN